MNIVILNECFISEAQITELEKENNVTSFDVTSTSDEAIERMKDAEIIFVDQFVCPLSNDILDIAKKLKLIILNTTSFHLVDQEYLKSRNIALCNTPDFCSDSVAELTFFYILSLMRKLIPAYRDNLEKPFEILPDVTDHRKYVGNNLSDKTIGVIGLGNIGQKICSIAQWFNMDIIGFNRSEKNLPWVEQLSLEELCEKSDIIIVTVPYDNTTHQLIDREYFDLMKEGVVIVNISSQEILDEDILIEKLKNREIWGYGLDNYLNKDKNHYFYNSDSVLILPHAWFFSQESLDMIGVRMMEGYRGFLDGKEVHRIV